MSIKIGKDGIYCLSGELVFATVEGILKETRNIFTGRSIAFDLSEVERADSAGLALLIEWMREAKSADMDIHFTHIPEQLKAISRASSLEHLLP